MIKRRTPSKTKKVCTFGEILFRFAIPDEQNWIIKPKISAYLGGSELNVANALACWKIPVKYCTAMPDNFISTQIENSLSKNTGITNSGIYAGVDTSAIKKFGERIGTYYLAENAQIQHAGIVYDRQNSSFSHLKTGMIDWEMVLEDCDWFHFSAIVPALNENLVAVCHEALKVATQKGITISIDLNYRSKLWAYTPDIISVMQPLVAQCDVVMGNVWSAQTLIGTSMNDKVKDVVHPENCLEQATETSVEIFKKYPKVKFVANTFRFSEDERTTYYGTLHTVFGFSGINAGVSHDILTALTPIFMPENYISKVFKTNTIVDRVGSGDCFMAGLIYGLLKNFDNQKIVNFAAAAAFCKLQERGDATRQTKKQILQRIGK